MMFGRTPPIKNPVEAIRMSEAIHDEPEIAKKRKIPPAAAQILIV